MRVTAILVLVEELWDVESQLLLEAGRHAPSVALPGSGGFQHSSAGMRPPTKKAFRHQIKRA